MFRFSVDDPSKCQQMVVKEALEMGLTKELSDHIKTCKIDLERIDQQLLELGPFAKDVTFKEEPGTTPTAVVGGVVQPSTPPSVQYQRSRKGNHRQPHGAGNRGAGKEKRRSAELSSPMSAVSPSLGADRAPVTSLIVEKMLGHNRDAAAAKETHPETKWRKVGSAGSPVVHTPVSSLPPKRSSVTPTSVPHHTDMEAGSPMTDTRVVPPLTQRSQPHGRNKPPGSRGSKGSVDADIDSPSMIPAASEIEMLSLYMPNSQWETIESSPLQPDHEPDLHSDSQRGDSLAPGGSRGASKNLTMDLLRADRTPTQSVSSLDSESTLSDKQQDPVEPERAAHRHHSYHHTGQPVVSTIAMPSSVASNWPSPLTTSMSRHTHRQAVQGVSEHASVETSPGTGELARHIVVKDGALVVTKPGFSVGHMTSSHHQHQHHHTSHHPHHPHSSHRPRDGRSSTPSEKSVTSPAGHVTPHLAGHVTHPAAHMTHPAGHVTQPPPPPHLNSDAHPKHRRSSSSSSMRSLNERKQPTPPGPLGQRPVLVSSSAGSLQAAAQQQMHLIGGELKL